MEVNFLANVVGMVDRKGNRRKSDDKEEYCGLSGGPGSYPAGILVSGPKNYHRSQDWHQMIAQSMQKGFLANTLS
jgi:hypothetical protein